MKKYRLNPDKLLPFTNEKMEVEIIINKNHNNKYEATTFPKSAVYFFLCSQEYLDWLIKEGYLLEVKPREWHVVVNKFNDVIGYGNVDKRVTEQYRLQNHGDRLDDFEIIHVQEID